MANDSTKTKNDRVGWLEKRGCVFRQFNSFEARAAEVQTEDGTDNTALYVEGIAVPLNVTTTLFTIDGVDYKERIDARAFGGADMSDVIFNYNHAGKVLARTRNTGEEKRDVFVNIKSVGCNEFYKAAQAGYAAELKLVMRSIDYDGEPLIGHSEKRYKVLRTYESKNGEFVEITATNLPERAQAEADAEGGGADGKV
jgi:hypothetical protein